MKSTIALVLCLVLVVAGEEQQYTSKFDHIDVDRVLKNDRLLRPYLNCLLKDMQCTPEARELKRLLPDALATKCEKCTAKQKEGSEKVIAFLSKNKPEEWEQVLEMYDKDHIYRTKYAAEAKARGIQV
uniref:Chemosensory protein 8 n=1 Tax=Encarsia formosa TaxID=32400 RepID=A0A6M5CJG7_ENCFO|nr:chemosensory protein 8 [Encarsia formosa]